MPDVILFQKVQILSSGLSQVEELKNKLNKKIKKIYPYSVHHTIYLKLSEQGKILETPKQYRMVVLCKHPITNSFNYFVVQTEELEPRSVLCFDIIIKEKGKKEIYNLANIHLENRQHWAKPQFENLLQFLKNRNENRILAGDFNLFDLQTPQNYYSSFDFQSYISYPNKNWTLDYILIPQKYQFKTQKLWKICLIITDFWQI